MKNGSEGRSVFRESRKRYRARENQSAQIVRFVTMPSGKNEWKLSRDK